MKADLVTFGKIIGGGMPVGAYCGSRALMEQVAPCGPVYQAGTLSGNPVAMAAGLAQLRYLQDHPEVYTDIAAKAQWLAEGMRAAAAEARRPGGGEPDRLPALPLLHPHGGHRLCGRQGQRRGPVRPVLPGHAGAGRALAPAQFEAMFVSAAHTQAELEATLAAVKAVFPQL